MVQVLEKSSSSLWHILEGWSALSNSRYIYTNSQKQPANVEVYNKHGVTVIVDIAGTDHLLKTRKTGL
jgi:hypothetical protein